MPFSFESKYQLKDSLYNFRESLCKRFKRASDLVLPLLNKQYFLAQSIRYGPLFNAKEKSVSPGA